MREADASIGRPAAAALVRGWLLAALQPDEGIRIANGAVSSGSGSCGGTDHDGDAGVQLHARTPQAAILADNRWVWIRT